MRVTCPCCGHIVSGYSTAHIEREIHRDMADALKEVFKETTAERDRHKAMLQHIANTDEADIAEPDIGAYLRDMARKALRPAQDRLSGGSE